MRARAMVAGAVIVLFAGCNSYKLRYRAEPQPAGAHVFADCTHLQGAVGIYVDTDGRRLEEIFVRRGDGSVVRPARIDYPAFGRSASIGPGIGVGIGSVGVGVGVGVPVGPKRAKGLTTATFEEGAIGAGPWEVHVKVEGIEECVVPGVGGRETAR